LNLGGVMVWSLDQDDYTGLFCRQGPFPFTRRVHDILHSSNDYHEQEFANSTKPSKPRTKPRVSFIPIQQLTSPHQKLTTTTTTILSSSKSRDVSSSVKNNSTLCLLLIVLFLI
jgi:hypothetical protein